MRTTHLVGTALALLLSRNAWAQTTPEPETPATPTIQLDLEGTPVGVRFHVTPLRTIGAPPPHGGKPGSCVAPCEGRVPPGTYRIALSAPGTSAVALDEPITISGPTVVRGELVSYKWLRTTGWTVLGAGTIALVALVVDANAPHHSTGVEGGDLSDLGLALLGTPILVVSLGVGIPMVLKSDEVKITVSPLATPRSPLGRSDTAPSIASALVPRGVGLSGEF